MSGVTAPYKRGPRELILFLLPVGTWQEGATHKPGSEPQPDATSAGALSWMSQHLGISCDLHTAEFMAFFLSSPSQPRLLIQHSLSHIRSTMTAFLQPICVVLALCSMPFSVYSENVWVGDLQHSGFCREGNNGWARWMMTCEGWN